jgi:hypothetical protein
MKYFLPVLLLLPLFSCGTFSEFGARYEAIEEETTTLLDGVDQQYTEGELSAEDRDELIREILQDSKERLDTAAREAGDDILTTGSDILDILLLVLFGGASGGGALALSRRIRGKQ